MKKKIIIIFLLILLFIGVSYVLIFYIKKDENMFTDISEYLNKEPGIYLINKDKKQYALAIYESNEVVTVKSLHIKVFNKKEKVIEEIETNSNTRKLKKGEKGYFIGQLKKEFNNENKYVWDVELSDDKNSYIVNGINIKEYIEKPAKLIVSNNGITICMYKNETVSNAIIKNCEVIFMDSNNKIVEKVIALPEKTNVEPGETIYFAGKAKNYSNKVDLSFSTVKYVFDN